MDLGRSAKYNIIIINRPGCRNTTKPGDEYRVFGLPTIRTDKKKNGLKSVADPQNYGDEKPVISLLFPEKFSHLGLDEKDFNRLRTKDDVNYYNYQLDLINI